MMLKKPFGRLVAMCGIAGGFLLLSTQYSCYKDNKETMYPPLGACDTTNTTWSADIQPMVQASCAKSGCHDASASAGINLTTYSGAKSIVDDGRFLRVIEDGSMPQGASKWDDCSINKLRRWINNGASNN
ncbi:MAG: hypothetical protein QM743_05745 [Chitinophagaceae bacterium]